MKITTKRGKQSRKAEWVWRKNYRIWDANRKIFIYPENWLEPELGLPDAFRLSLCEIVAFATKRIRKPAHGKSVRVLFTGKDRTTALVVAKTLASDLGKDLYRIDLSSVVSKYIGETEKNLRRIFDAAEKSDAVLFFDEADSLFGKRTEVKDSHDRYANIEISYLLQRIEDRGGLTILSATRKDSLDSAFLRRLRFIVRLPPRSGVERLREN